MAAGNQAKKASLASLVSLGISLGSPAFADESAWDCRVSADASSWDCYQDGTLVMQPMPQTPAPVVKPAEQSLDQPQNAVKVPDPVEPVEIEIKTEAVSATAAPALTDKPQPEIKKDIKVTPAEEPVAPELTTIEPVQATFVDPVMPQPAPAIPTEAVTAVSAASLADQQAEDQITAKPSEVVEAKPQANQIETVTEKTIDTQKAQVSSSQVQPSRPQYCRSAPRQIMRTAKTSLDETETNINADDAVMQEAAGIADFAGDVVLTAGDQTVRSDSLQYDSNTSEVHASGNIHYARPDLNLQAESAQLNLDKETGQINQAVYQLPANNARGSAAKMQLVENGVTVYQDASYTTCEAGNNDWLFNAGELEINQNTGMGRAKDIKLLFKDTQIISLPWATFPVDDRRISGFLVPSIGSSDSTGLDVNIPYYFNLAPNYDATFTPRIMSERGILLGGELRYLDRLNRTTFNAEFLPDDNDYENSDARGAAALVHSTDFNERLKGSLNLNYVSDNDYLEDLGGSLALTSTRHLQRTASLKYFAEHYSLTGKLQEYQTIEDGLDEPYKLLPQITFNSSRYFSDSPLNGELWAQYTHFDHELDSRAKGGRFDIMPSLAYDWRQSWGFLTPRASIRYTSYDLDDHTTDSVDRSTSTFSLDGGLIFERDTSWFANKAVQTLEPRLFYVYTPAEDQRDIPLFDTGNYTFNDAFLFRENRFSGPDRIGDANQITAAITTRLLSQQTGRQYLAATLGQIFYFEDREVFLDYTSPDSDAAEDSSSYVATVTGNPARNWRVDAGLQWDADFEQTEKGSFRIKYEDDEKHLFSARYQYDQAAKLEYTKLSAYWPVAFNTRLVGHSYYSLEEDRAIETVAGIEHGSSCCWRFRALVRDYQINAEQDSNLSFLLQLELSGFAQLGDDIDSFLEETINGFVREK